MSSPPSSLALPAASPSNRHMTCVFGDHVSSLLSALTLRSQHGKRPLSGRSAEKSSLLMGYVLAKNGGLDGAPKTPQDEAVTLLAVADDLIHENFTRGLTSISGPYPLE
ncbi:hypothetical protein CRG98_047592 [Punica granatum]|uniref:Uncharacterized protein n=1 Tax=Punica granatum TaxID=22663 RepID=A0A2I0HJY8_PUNGR|nr:hypothetical protein CRG98_047592 [Punica granatum]